MRTRSERRHLTERESKRQMKIWSRSSFRYGETEHYSKESHRFAKKHGLACYCTKKKKGSPKHGWGPCYGFCVRPTVKERRSWKQQLRRWPRG